MEEEEPQQQSSSGSSSPVRKAKDLWRLGDDDDDVRRTGYRSMATYMGLYGSRLAIFRRFGDLNMLCLMSLQAELMDLRHELQRSWEKDEKEPNCVDLTKSAFSFAWLREYRGFSRQRSSSGRSTNHLLTPPLGSHESANSHSPLITQSVSGEDDTAIRLEQEWRLLEKIREKLRVYNKTLLEVAQVQRLNRPKDRDVEDLWEMRKTIRLHDYSNLKFEGEERKAWSDNLYDLVTVNPAPNKDLFQEVTSLIFELKGRGKASQYRLRSKFFESLVGEMNAYREWYLSQFSAWIATIIAATIPALLVLILYRIKETSTRLYSLIGFTIGFAISMKIFTTARRVEMFGATAAFVAVGVVFVGSPSTRS